MTDFLDLAPAQRGPVERTTTTPRSDGGAGQSIYWALMPFEGGAGQSWAGPGTDWFPFEGGAEQSLDPRPGGSPFEG